MLKLKLLYFGHLMWRADSFEIKSSCWETLMAGGEGDDRGWYGWMASPTQWLWVWVSSGSWWWTGRPGVLQSMGSQKLDMTEPLNWTELNWFPETWSYVALELLVSKGGFASNSSHDNKSSELDCYVAILEFSWFWTNGKRKGVGVTLMDVEIIKKKLGSSLQWGMVDYTWNPVDSLRYI